MRPLILWTGFEPVLSSVNDLNFMKLFLFVYVVEIPGLIKSDRVFAHRFQQDPEKDFHKIHNQPQSELRSCLNHSATIVVFYHMWDSNPRPHRAHPTQLYQLRLNGTKVSFRD